LVTGKKISKNEANYRIQEELSQEGQSCVKCKFNPPAEKKCHIIEGEIDNERGLSEFFSPKGDGMLPGDIVWDFIKKGEKKLDYEEGHVISRGLYRFISLIVFLLFIRAVLFCSRNLEPHF
jgi:hypothetical protein